MDRLATVTSHFDLPTTVRVSASIPSAQNEITLHFVNYNRREPADKQNAGSGIKDENPIPAPAGKVELRLPQRCSAASVDFLTPEQENGKSLEFTQDEGRLRFEVPEFLVYCLVRVKTAPRQ
jgi:hypothetical protein